MLEFSLKANWYLALCFFILIKISTLTLVDIVKDILNRIPRKDKGQGNCLETRGCKKHENLSIIGFQMYGDGTTTDWVSHNLSKQKNV